MDSSQGNSTSLPPDNVPEAPQSTSTVNDSTVQETTFLSASGITSWARSLRISQPTAKDDSEPASMGKSTFSRFSNGFGLNLSPKARQTEDTADHSSMSTTQPGVFGSLTKGLVDSSKNAVKAVQVKARHMVSQNKRRYQEGEFDLDMTYITENIIAMGFPAGDMSSGFFGYVEGFYRNHMEEVIKFFESHHKGKYKVYNLCSERLYDASLFEGKVASFPFDDHNCPPIHLITLFCQSAYSWLKQDIENVVVVHCKAGMARTGLMISSLLLYLKFFPTAEESIDYYNQKRCLDGKGLVLPSQIRYVKYFERILTYFNGENQPGRRCMLRGFRIHKCPYWVRPSITVSNHNGILFSTKKHRRTKDLMPEDFWFSVPKKGIMVFALPGEPGLAEVTGDFKVHFHDRHGDFYCWLNTTMMENRKILDASEIDGFDKRKLPSPGFQLEVVLVDYDGAIPPRSTAKATNKETNQGSGTSSATGDQSKTQVSKPSESGNKDEVFSDSESEEPGSSKSKRAQVLSGSGEPDSRAKSPETKLPEEKVVRGGNNEQLPVRDDGSKKQASVATETKREATVSAPPVFETPKMDSTGASEFKAIAADASVFSFGDEDDYESE